MIGFSRVFLTIAAFGGVLVACPQAHAGPAKEKLLGCFSRSATDDDYAAISDQMYASTVSEQHGIALDTVPTSQQRADATMSRLLTKDCAQEVQAAEKTEGPAAVKFAIGQLSIMAMGEMLSKIPSESGALASPSAH